MIADIILSTEAIVVITGLLSALTAALVTLFKMLMAAKDAQLAEEKASRKAYQNIAEEAVRVLEGKAKQFVIESDGIPVLPIAPVVPEHSSPITDRQEATAKLATLRAQLTAAKLALNVEGEADG